jgi:hypothetical protein
VTDTQTFANVRNHCNDWPGARVKKIGQWTAEAIGQDATNGAQPEAKPTQKDKK